jgi:hypothetical protein
MSRPLAADRDATVPILFRVLPQSPHKRRSAGPAVACADRSPRSAWAADGAWSRRGDVFCNPLWVLMVARVPAKVSRFWMDVLRLVRAGHLSRQCSSEGHIGMVDREKVRLRRFRPLATAPLRRSRHHGAMVGEVIGTEAAGQQLDSRAPSARLGRTHEYEPYLRRCGLAFFKNIASATTRTPCQRGVARGLAGAVKGG